FLIYCTINRPPSPTLFPYTTLFRSLEIFGAIEGHVLEEVRHAPLVGLLGKGAYVHHETQKRTALGLGVGADEIGQAVIQGPRRGDRKSTRLNSSHVKISYAVFCLKK